MTLHVRAKVLLHVWSYDFYDTTLTTSGMISKHIMIPLLSGELCSIDMIQYVFSVNIQFFRYNGHLVDIATTNEQGDVKITMQDVAATLLGDESIFGRSVHVSDFISYHARQFIPDLFH